MKNTKNYIAPAVELYTISTKEACMLEASGEATNSSLSIDFSDLLG